MTKLVTEGPVYRSLRVIKAVRAGYKTAKEVMQKTGMERSTVAGYLKAGYETGLLERKSPKRQGRGAEPFIYWMP
jgi:transposase